MRVSLTKGGAIVVRPRGQREFRLLKKLDFLRWKKGVAAAHWSYIDDLRDHCGAHSIEYAPEFRDRLVGLVGRIKALSEGSEEEVLAAFAEGARPYPYQVEGIHTIVNGERILLADDTGLGKQQPVDALVGTPSGWRMIGDLVAGDFVIGSDGKPTRVTGIFPQGVKESFRVGFSDGSSVEVGAEHLWSVDYRRGGRRWHRLTLTTDQLRTRPIVDGLDLSKTRLYLPMLSGPVEFDAVEPPAISGYVMGALIANGCLGHGTPQLVYSIDDWAEVEMLLAAADFGRPRFYGNCVHVTVRGVVAEIRRLGLDVGSRDKFIPEEYATASVGTRTALLHGLMDADGTITATRNRITYSTSSERLANDVRALVESLGGIASVKRYKRSHYEEGRFDFCVRMRLPEWVKPFRLRRKVERYQPKSGSVPRRVVESVEYVRDVESVCIAVAAPDRLYLTEHCILTHNTIITIGAMAVLARRRELRRAIVVCPAGLKYQWIEQIHEFAEPDAFRGPVAIVDGSPGARRVLYRRPWRVLVINYELVRNDEAILRNLQGVDFVALDEASCIRNPDAAITQAMTDLARGVRFRVALTATPVENRLADLCSVMRWVNPTVFPSVRYFRQRYVIWKKIRFRVGGRTIVKMEPKEYQRLGEVKKKIRGNYIRRTVKDVGIQLPKLIVQWETLNLGRRQRDVYEAMRAQTEGADLREGLFSAPVQALRQACNSTLLVEKKSAGKRPAHVKVSRLKELLETELLGEQVIAFTDYERFVRIVKDALPRNTCATFTGKEGPREKQRAIRQFTSGSRRILLATKAAERGLNLQCASVVVNLDLPFNPAALKQRIGRAIRAGSKHGSVRMINMIALDTIEERLVLKKIYSKRKLFETLFAGDELSEADPVERLNTRDLRKLL